MESLSESGNLLDMAGVAKRLGCTERYVRFLWDSRQLAAVKVGRRVRFTPQAVDDYIASHEVPAVR